MICFDLITLIQLVPAIKILPVDNKYQTSMLPMALESHDSSTTKLNDGSMKIGLIVCLFQINSQFVYIKYNNNKVQYFKKN